MKPKLIINLQRKLLLAVLLLAVSASWMYAQTRKITLDADNQSVAQVLKQIEQKSGFTFFYKDNVVDLNRKVSVSAKDEDILSVLGKVFAGTPVTAAISGDKTISLSKADVPATAPAASAQTRGGGTVTGSVLDTSGQPVVGATVMVEGTQNGVVTDLDGRYSIRNVPANGLLRFSCLGYEDQVKHVNGASSVNAIISEVSQSLDAGVVVAFGTQKKESVLASIATVNPTELKVPSSNLTTALAGRVAGLVSYQRSGEPGEDDASFFVRGVTSFSYAASPLILIDGIQMTSTDLARLQPDDIASFSILKDATATALYGAQGGNGVIMVTTKEGREGPASISFRYETSVSEPTRMIELTDPITYMNLNNEAVLTRDPTALTPYSQSKIDNTAKGTNPYMYPTNDWYNLLFKKSTVNHRANFNVNGGGKVAQYYIAGTFNKDTGVLKTEKGSDNNININKFQLRSNINIKMTKTTDVVVRLSGTFDDYSGPLNGGSALFQKVMRSDPVAFPATFAADAANKSTNHILFGNADTGNYINPYADMVRGFKSYSTSKMAASVEVKQNLAFITEGLKLRAMFSTDRYSYFDLTRSYNPYYYSIGYYDKNTGQYVLNALNPNGGTEYLSYSEGTKTVNTTNYGQAILSYGRDFGKHNISLMTVGQIRHYQTGNAGSLLMSLPQRNLGLSGRATYNYDSRYFLEFNFGYNGSERFAKNERWGFFPSFGGAWLVSNEPFWKKADNFLTRTLTKLKLKGTYGLVGNDQIGSSSDRFFYMSDITMNDSARKYSWGENYNYTQNGISINRYGNDKITWEVAKKMNLGVELGFFDELEISAEYYTEYRTNILMSRADIPSSMGLLVDVKSNIGEASGHGVDLSADWNHSFSRDFWISGRANFTYAKTRYEVFEEPDFSATPWRSHVGQPIGQTWGYVAERLFVDDREVANSPIQNFGTSAVMGGDIKYRDINGDDRISSLDRVPIGYPTRPEIIYGFGLSTGFKGLDFSFFFQGLGHESFWIDVNNTAPFIDPNTSNSVVEKNQLMKVYADDHWSENNRNVRALWPRLSATLNQNNSQTSTWFMRDGSFLRLKSVELGYRFPDHLMRKAYIKNLRIYTSGTNLLTFSKFKLWDPEMAGSGLGYPVQRVFNFGVQLTF